MRSVALIEIAIVMHGPGTDGLNADTMLLIECGTVGILSCDCMNLKAPGRVCVIHVHDARNCMAAFSV